MKSPSLKVFSFVSAVLWITFGIAPVTFAASCNGVTTSIDYTCSSSTDPVSAIAVTVINFMAIGVGIAVVGGIVWGALRYTSADGNASQSQQGIHTIVNSVLGLVVFIFMYAIVNFLVPGGAFNANGSIVVSQSTPGKITYTGPVVVHKTPDANDDPVPSGGGGSSSGIGGGGTTTSPTVPTLSGVYNFRQVGPIPILYRSANLHKATSADTKRLSSLLDGGTIIDLRTASTRSDSQDQNIDGVKNISLPVSAPDTGDYSEFVTKNASRVSFGAAMKAIASSDGPILIHCTYGKDRTGWLVAMIMYSLGASDDEVMTEYMKSNDSLPSGEYVKASWLNAGLDAARAKYGSIDTYIQKGLGVSDATLAALKTKLGSW